jgi:hypothetical protein
MTLIGECNCGAIKVTIADQPPESASSVLCHCLNCRKQSGGIGTWIMVIPDEDITLEGQPKEYLDTKTDSGKDLKRWFCGTCGRCGIQMLCNNILEADCQSSRNSPIMSTSQLAPGKQCRPPSFSEHKLMIGCTDSSLQLLKWVSSTRYPRQSRKHTRSIVTTGSSHTPAQRSCMLEVRRAPKTGCQSHGLEDLCLIKVLLRSSLSGIADVDPVKTRWDSSVFCKAAWALQKMRRPYRGKHIRGSSAR